VIRRLNQIFAKALGVIVGLMAGFPALGSERCVRLDGYRDHVIVREWCHSALDGKSLCETSRTSAPLYVCTRENGDKYLHSEK